MSRNCEAFARVMVCALVFIITCNYGAFAQKVSGYVTDRSTGSRLIGANVIVYQANSLTSVTSTDSTGFYSLELSKRDVDALEVRFVGYKTYRIPLQWKSEDQSVNISLEADALLSVYPMIRAKALQKPGELLMTNSFFRRLPGSFNDPSRLLIRFPALSSPNDQANQIVVKGLPPHMAKWTIDGAFIINPNHLSNAGSITDQASASGGGVNMISGRWIDQYRFFTTPLPSTMADGGSGISDTRLTMPSSLSYGIGLLGTELSYRHDFNNNLSAGLAYRYSTLGILSALGVDLGDEVISFQDLHFMLQKSQGKSHWKYHFLWGNSKNDHDDLGTESITYKDAQQINFTGQQMIHHLGYSFITNPFKYRTSLNYSQRSSTRFSAVSDVFPSLQKTISNNLQESLISWSQHADFRISQQEFSFHTLSQFNRFVGDSEVERWFNTQYFALSHTREYRNLELDLGAGTSIHRDAQVHPELRTTLRYRFDQFHKLQAAYALQGQSIFSQFWAKAPELRAFTSHNISLDYYVNTDKSYLQLGLFYHYYSNLPTLGSTKVSYLDRLDLMLQGIEQGYAVEQDGAARLWGMLAQYEILKIDRFQGIVAASLYNLQARSADQQEFDLEPSYDFGYTSSFTGSYTWTVRSNPLVVSLAYQLRGAENHLPIDEATSFEAQSTIYQFDAEKSKISGFRRLDLKCHYSWGKKKQHMISLDIQNVTNRTNLAYPYYDPLQQNVQIQNQLGLIPILSFNSSI